MKNKKFLLVIFCAVATVFGGTAVSEEDSVGVIEYRQSIMSAIAGHFGAARRIVNGAYSAEGHLEFHAETLAFLMRDISHYFPEGSGAGDTEAEAMIWEDWQGFSERADAATNASKAFSEAAASGDNGTIESAYGELRDACRGCHKRFRK
ncbi:MAG: cytochrome c [Gammaproteobacteria bacterium]|nr:cytochrome c [Gammaproteobacteria bacterium]